MARSSSVLRLVENDAADTVEQEETLSDLMNKLSANAKAQRPLKAKLKPLEDEATALKNRILPLMMKEGLSKTSTKTETVSVTEIKNVIIDDLDTMLRALKKEGFQHILTVKEAQAREFAQLKGKEIPGTHTEVVSRHIRVSAIK